MSIRHYFAAAIVLPTAGHAAPDELAKVFGARETVISGSLSPDGEKIALVTAGTGRLTRVQVLEAREGAEPRSVATGTGVPEYLRRCEWVANDRLACLISGEQRYADDVYGFSSMFAVDAAGGNIRSLSTRRGQETFGIDLRGGSIVDLLPGEDGAVLMARSYVPDAKISGGVLGERDRGLGVDRVDTRTGSVKSIEKPSPEVYQYISDGRSQVRIKAQADYKGSGFWSGKSDFFYRPVDGGGWKALSTFDERDNSGFYPLAVDADKNLAYGLEKIDGRSALVSVALDAGLEKKTVFSHPAVDVSSVVTVGRDRRPVGAGYVDDAGRISYFDPAVRALSAALGKALGGKTTYIADVSQDQNRALVWAGSDVDPGQYYLYDRRAKSLAPVTPDRPQLAGRTLAPMQFLHYKAQDGTSIPAYLTLPPGRTDAKGLPAIVMPHGGPQSRDQWGFDWMVQYFAARGFAVVQPQFRGSAGFGEEWMVKSAFTAWRTAVGDVVDSGRWLVAEQGVDPARLTIFGWSYGGYAALQSQALAPDLFKAIVAVAPVTDIAAFLKANRWSSSYVIQKEFLGSGRAGVEASPTSHVGAFGAPVLMFHGTDDGNVDIKQSRLMESKLRGAGKSVSLVVYEGLTHSLNDSDARADMLQQASDFLLRAGRP